MSDGKSSGSEHVVDTVPALKALMDSVGTTYRECARVFGTGHSPLCKAVNRKGRRPTLDTLVRWAARAREEAGVETSFLIENIGTPDLRMKAKITTASGVQIVGS